MVGGPLAGSAADELAAEFGIPVLARVPFHPWRRRVGQTSLGVRYEVSCASNAIGQMQFEERQLPGDGTLRGGVSDARRAVGLWRCSPTPMETQLGRVAGRERSEALPSLAAANGNGAGAWLATGKPERVSKDVGERGRRERYRLVPGSAGNAWLQGA